MKNRTLICKWKIRKIVGIKREKIKGGLQMVTTRKLRRAGNSSVVSVPTEVIAALRLQMVTILNLILKIIK